MTYLQRSYTSQGKCLIFRQGKRHLIAEEVAEVAPELVVRDAEGEPYSVRYHVLPSMLLNEVQKQQRVNEGQGVFIEEQREVIAALAGRIERLESRLGAELEGANR